jgi:thymidylate kinase
MVDSTDQFKYSNAVCPSRRAGATTIFSHVELHPNRPNFLRALFRLLDDFEVCYCVLHSWESLPQYLPSDLDMAVHPHADGKLLLVFRQLQTQGYRVAQCFNYFANAYYFVFVWFEKGYPKFAAVDIIFEHRRSGLAVASGNALVAGRRRYKDFWVASHQTEFGYLLAKKTWKGKTALEQALRMKSLVEQLGCTRAEKIVGGIFLDRSKKRVLAACADGSINEVLGHVQKQPWRTSIVRHPRALASYLRGECRRIARRWFQPTGLLVAVLGPDGVGKSTLIEQLRMTFGGAFRREQYFHWRPAVFARPSPKKATTDPHAKPSRAAWLSILYLMAFFLDHCIGYAMVIRPLLARSGFVVFDRYFHDVQVDPRRFRYGGPNWLPRLLSRLVPSPDLVLLLDADENVILSRKRELSADETKRQREIYQRLKFPRAQTVIVNTACGEDLTLQQGSKAVVEYLTQRFERRQLSSLAETELTRGSWGSR